MSRHRISARHHTRREASTNDHRPHARHEGPNTTPTLPPMLLHAGLSVRDTFINVAQRLPRIPAFVPPSTQQFSPAAPVSSPHCIENTGQAVIDTARPLITNPNALAQFARDVAHQVVDSGQHDILLTAGLKAGSYANGLEVPGTRGQTSATYTMRLGVHNGRLSGRITVTPYLIQHGPGIPGTSLHLPSFVTAQITSIDISQDARGRIQFTGNILGSPIPLPITDQVTPMLFGTSEPVLVSTPSALTERIINYYTADPRRAQGVNMVDPNTIALSLRSNVDAHGTINHNTLRVGPITISDMHLDAQFEARPSDRGFVLRIPRTGFRELRIHTDSRCGAANTPDTTLTNAGISDLELDFRYRMPADAAIPVYLHSLSATVRSGQINANGDLIVTTSEEHPMTVNATGTPNGDLNVALRTTPFNVTHAAVTAQTPAGAVNTTVTGITSPAVTYNIALTNIFDTTNATARVSTSDGTPETRIARVDLSGSALQGYGVSVRDIVNGAQSFRASGTLGGFNPLTLLGMENPSFTSVLAAITGIPEFTFGATQTQAGLAGLTVTDPNGTEVATYVTAPMVCGAVSVSASNRGGVNAQLDQCTQPTSTTQVSYRDANRRLNLTSIVQASGLDFSLGLSRTGQANVGLNVPTFNSNTNIFASAGFLRWARSLLPASAGQRISGLPLRSIAINSEVTSGPGGISVTTSDHGHTHRAHVAIRARNTVRTAGVRVATRDAITADIAVRDTAEHRTATAPQFALSAGANRLSINHAATVAIAGQRLTLSGRTLVSDTNNGRLTATDTGSLTLPTLGIANGSTLALAADLPVSDGVYTQIPPALILRGRLQTHGTARERTLPQGATVAGSLIADNRFTVDLPSGAFHAHGTSDLRLNAGIATGEGNGRVNLTVQDLAHTRAQRASPFNLAINDSLTARATIGADIRRMTPAGEIRVLGGADLPVATEGGGVRVQVNSVNGTARALRAWGVGAPEGRTGRRGTPHGSR